MLTETQTKILKIVNNQLTSSNIAKMTGITHSSIYKNIKDMQMLGVINRSEKIGRCYYILLTNEGKQVQELIYQIDSILFRIEKNK